MSEEESENITRYPDYGPLDISDSKDFLQEAETFFNQHWDNPFVYEDNLSNYEFIKWVGKGSFGKVALSEHIKEKKYFAIKLLLKDHLVKKKRVVQSLNEIRVIEAINCPFAIYLVSLFMDSSYIYYVLPYISGGDYYAFLTNHGKVNETKGRFYMAQVVLALEYLHHLSLIYRDLKPENILIDHTGYLKLADFGLCKRLKTDRTYTFCGTPYYLAPEVISGKGYGLSVDWWCFGVLLFESMSGDLPFNGENNRSVVKKILHLRYSMPHGFTKDLRDLIKHLLQTDLSRRFGNMKNGVGDIKNHKWFRPIHWLAILNRKVPAYTFPELSCSSHEKSKNEQFPINIKFIDEHNDIFSETFGKKTKSGTIVSSVKEIVQTEVDMS